MCVVLMQVWVPWRGLHWHVASYQGSMTAVCLLVPEPPSRYFSDICDRLSSCTPVSLSWLLFVVVFIGDCVCFKCGDLAWVFCRILGFISLTLWHCEVWMINGWTLLCCSVSFLCCDMVNFFVFTHRCWILFSFKMCLFTVHYIVWIRMTKTYY